MNISPAETQKMTYDELYKALRDNGYRSIQGISQEDLDYADLDQEGYVIEMTVDDSGDFKERKRYPKNARIEVKYHSAKEVKPPGSAKELKGQQYKKVAKEFKKLGFGNVKTEGEKDSFITKWMKNEGEVKSVTIGGETDYSETESYRVDEIVVISYHKE